MIKTKLKKMEDIKMCNTNLNMEQASAFEEKMVNILNSGALALMVSIGHRTRLFDTMAGMEFSTSQQVAEAASLNERYVREWLGAMVSGGIIDCKANGKGSLYRLPSEHSEYLTRTAQFGNFAVFAQYIPLLGGVEDKILECFEKGGGVPYSEYTRFHEVMAEDSGQTVVAALIESILPLAPGLTDSLEKGIDVLDVGCGMGRALNLMAKHYPNSRFTGMDLSEEAVANANARAKQDGLKNIRFEVKDLTGHELKHKYDLITAFDAVHDQARPDIVLDSVSGALKEDGLFLMQDIAAHTHHHDNLEHPIGPLLYTISTMHCMSVSLAQNGMGLGTMWGEEKALEMLGHAGFHNVDIKKLDHDFQNNFYMARKA
jgi:2-polyprenyl-3-methyl-5-hydroxy-6-metoxy-1,4-benzoquinol methylase